MKVKKGLIFLFFLLISIGSSLYANGEGDTIDPATLEGKLVYAEGTILINGSDSELGAVVLPGDTIKTGPEGRADIVFGSQNIISFGADTVSTIDPAWGGVNISHGIFRTVLNGLSKLGFGAENPFKVQTSTAVMAVRGTTFFTYVPKEGETYFCDCNGVVDLTSPDGNVSQTIDAGHHEAYWLVQSESGEVKSFPTEFDYHTDEEMDILAARAKTRIRWRK